MLAFGSSLEFLRTSLRTAPRMAVLNARRSRFDDRALWD